MQIPVTCPHCARVTELDPAKIPDKPVSFACPGCQGKVPVDGAKLKGEAAVAAQPASGGSGSANEASAEVPAGSAPATDALQHLELPEGTRFPPGLIVSSSGELQRELEPALAKHGCSLRTSPDIAAAQALMSLAMPELIFFEAGAVGTPPLAEIQPLLEIESDDRRRVFIVMVADNLKSMDGNAAFFHGVDLILNRADVGLIDRILFSAMQFRDKLAGPFIEALATVEG